MEWQDRISTRLAARSPSTSVNDDGPLSVRPETFGTSGTPRIKRRQLVPEDGAQQLDWNNMDTSGDFSQHVTSAYMYICIFK
jgi:hypothetical protein